MAQTGGLACQLLKLEQQLQSYERLHASEMAELWQILNECKRAVADVFSVESDNSTAASTCTTEACAPSDLDEGDHSWKGE